MLIDVSMPIKKGVVSRMGTPTVEITSRKFYHESEGEYESVMLSLPAHTRWMKMLEGQDKRTYNDASEQCVLRYIEYQGYSTAGEPRHYHKNVEARFPRPNVLARFITSEYRG